MSVESYNKIFFVFTMSWSFIFNSQIIHNYYILLKYQLTAGLQIKTGLSIHRYFQEHCSRVLIKTHKEAKTQR